MSQQQAESITVYSDYVCPFCYLGRHSLRQYQERREDELKIDWHPFDLRAGKRGPDGEIDPDGAGGHADDGKDDEYYEQAKENVRRLQEQYDVEMSLDLATDVDSFDAQAASQYVKEAHPYGTWLDFDWGVFEALWTESRDIGDRDVIADVARDAGLDADEVLDAVDDAERRDRLRETFQEAHEQGVTGVPTFAYEGYAARGAVPPEQLERLVEGS